MVFGGDEHQFAVDFNARIHRVTVVGLYRQRVIAEIEGQRHLAFDRASLLVNDFRRGIGQ
ncbi:hypothetical protein D3C87_2183820 [compost metagenome]